MINIDASTVAVETSAELKSVLEGDNSITLVYLANDIYRFKIDMSQKH